MKIQSWKGKTCSTKTEATFLNCMMEGHKFLCVLLNWSFRLCGCQHHPVHPDLRRQAGPSTVQVLLGCARTPRTCGPPTTKRRSVTAFMICGLSTKIGCFLKWAPPEYVSRMPPSPTFYIFVTHVYIPRT